MAALSGFRKLFHSSASSLALYGQSLSSAKFLPAVQRFYTTYHSDGASISLNNGLPMITLPLPSRREACQFTLRPLSDTVGDFIYSVQDEDGGVERVAVYTKEGTRIAASTTVDMLVQEDFDVVVNDTRYRVAIPDTIKSSIDGVQGLSDVKTMVHKLYTSLNVDQHQLNKKRELEGQIEDLKSDLAPLEREFESILTKSKRQTNGLLWLGLGAMGIQFGFFARLTWYEYSWDIMEPVTYFVTYGTLMVMYAYFVLTRQEYTYPDAKDRMQLFGLYRAAKKSKFDVEKYNQLKEAIASVDGELQKLKDPLQLNLPTVQNRHGNDQ